MVEIIRQSGDSLRDPLAVLIGGDAHVEAGDGQIGHDVRRAAAVDFAAVDGDAIEFALKLIQARDELGGGENRAAAGLKISADMRGFPPEDDREISRSLAS